MDQQSANFQEKMAKIALDPKWVLVFALGIAFVLGAVILIFHLLRFTPSTTIEYQPAAGNTVVNDKIIVDVGGGIREPGIVELPVGSRIQDAIAAAGGFSDDADQERIDQEMNLAAKLVDGTKLYIPVEGDSGRAGVIGGSEADGGDVEGVQNNSININNTTKTSLESLPGIGPKTAEKIIANRPYARIEELLEKKIVSRKVFSDIKDRIVVY